MKTQTMDNSKSRMVWNVTSRESHRPAGMFRRQFSGGPKLSIVIQTVWSGGPLNTLQDDWLSVDSSDQVTSGVLLAPSVVIPLQLPNHTHPPLLTSPACRHPLSRGARVRAQREICGGQHGTWRTRTGFSPSTSDFLCQYYSTSDPFWAG